MYSCFRALLIYFSNNKKGWVYIQFGVTFINVTLLNNYIY